MAALLLAGQALRLSPENMQNVQLKTSVKATIEANNQLFAQLNSSLKAAISAAQKGDEEKAGLDAGQF